MLSIRLLNKCVSSFCKAKKFEKAESLIDDGIRLGILPDVVTYNTLFDAYCRFGAYDAACSVVNEMSEFGISPNVTTYHSVAAQLAEENYLSQSLQMFQKIFILGFPLDLWSCNKMMHLCFKLGHSDESYRVFKNFMLGSGLSPSQETFNILINGFCKNGHVDDALRFFRMFRSSKHQGFTPGLVTYNNLIDALCKTGRLQTARGILEELGESGHEPNAITYIKVMKLCFRSKDYEQGLEIISELRSKLGFSLDGFAYCTIVGVLVKAGRMEEANYFKEQMMSDGIELDLVSYNVLLHQYLKKGNFVAANEVIQKAACLRFDQCTLAIMVNEMCKVGQIVMALRCLYYMIMSGFRSNLVAFNCLIDWFCKHGQIDRAMELFDLMEKKDSITYTKLVHNLCKETRFFCASKLMLACFKDGLRIPKRTQRAVLDGIRNQGKESFFTQNSNWLPISI